MKHVQKATEKNAVDKAWKSEGCVTPVVLQAAKLEVAMILVSEFHRVE